MKYIIGALFIAGLIAVVSVDYEPEQKAPQVEDRYPPSDNPWHCDDDEIQV